jgi:hypothetical protein
MFIATSGRPGIIAPLGATLVMEAWAGRSKGDCAPAELRIKEGKADYKHLAPLGRRQTTSLQTEKTKHKSAKLRIQIPIHVNAY